MPYLLDTTTTSQCTHGGSATPLTSQPRVKINGAPVLTVATQLAVAGCPNAVGTSPFPCVLAAFPAGATRVKAMGVPVLLDTSQALNTPTGVTLTVLDAQRRVKGL